MTRSIAEPRPHPPQHRPVLRRLSEILPPPQPPEHPPPPPTTAPPQADPSAPAQVARVLHATVELLGGRRPAAQLAAVLRPDLLAYLVAQHRMTGRLQPRVRKVLTRQQSAATLEAVVLVTLTTGVRALAARFERPADGDGRWRCTALQLRLTTGDLIANRR
ncbi:MAG TPA: Rv3235 family protein [Pseudonocardiaceae bacterium]